VLAADPRVDEYERCRPELLAYATRLVVRHEVAEEIVQEAALRLITRSSPLAQDADVRPWLFTVVSNLAIDHLRRHSSWRETVLVDARDRAASRPEFLETSRALQGSPELKAIAREHLVVCMACTLRNLPPHQSAALLLKEVYGFTVAETAGVLEVSSIQIKNWLQSARRTLEAKYAATCALVTQQGVCHQCVELDGFFNGSRRDPLEGTARDLDSRLEILKQDRDAPLGPWHQRMLRLIDDLLSD
jgi:RNA polymerase sigma-70 factor (ECF subfamily)